MAVRIYGNIGRTFQKPNAPSLTIGNRIIVHATADADIAYLDAKTIWRPGVINAGVTLTFTESSGTLGVHHTLHDLDFVMQNPTAPIWTTENATVANLASILINKVFTVLRLTFTAKGKVHLAAE